MFDCNMFNTVPCLPFITNLSLCKITLATELLVRCDLNHFAIMVQRCAPTGPSNILTHTSNAKCFKNVILINIRGLDEIIVPVRGYGNHSPNQAMIIR